jgi:hypothetical protein
VALIHVMSSTYELAVQSRDGQQRLYHYLADAELHQGSVIEFNGRRWLVERVDGSRAAAVPARYRLTLRHPDGHEESGALRRQRSDAPEPGHQLTTMAGRSPVSWTVVEERLARDEDGQAFTEYVAERDYSEVDSLPDHQLEHSIDRDESTPPAVARAQATGLSIELVSLEPGHAPDWDEARRFLDALVLEELGDDLLELCGIDFDHDRRTTWLDIARGRLREDLERFREDIETDRDQIEQWEFRDGRVFAAVGEEDDEYRPDTGYGWMCRLVDGDVLGAAGFRRVRQAQLTP